MNRVFKHLLQTLPVIAFGLILSGCASAPPQGQVSGQQPAKAGTAQGMNADNSQGDATHYNKYETTQEAVDFLGGSAEGIAKMMDRAFSDYGRPNAYIEGEEGGGSFAVGVRYGQGVLVTKRGQRMHIFWQGPSVGWDFGADAGRVFMLVYNLPDTQLIFQRFAGVSGSLYFIGGVGMNYLASQDIVVAPIRVGVGIHLGASIGYLQFTQKQSLNPF